MMMTMDLHHDTSFAEHEERSDEKKMVTMSSGCANEQTSADASIQGKPSGAMSWALLKTVRADETPTYEEVNIASGAYSFQLTILTKLVGPSCDSQSITRIELRSSSSAVHGSQDGLEQAADDIKA